MKRTLTLTREPLTELSPADLLNVAGAALPTGQRDCLNTWQICYTEAAGGSRCFCPTEA